MTLTRWLIIRLAVTGCAACLVMSAGCHAIVSRAFLPRDGIRQAEYAVSIERNVTTTTEDGVELKSIVYLPKTLEKASTVLVRAPFLATSANRVRADAAGRFWASRGYAVVIQGTRGRFESGGQFYPLRDERTDGIETLRWLAAQPWYNGRIGMWGGSTFGFTQWAVADQSLPGPSALDIQIASSDFREMLYRGGAFSLESALLWAVREHSQSRGWPSFRALSAGYDGFPMIEADDRVAGDIPWFDDWVLHDEDDDYWTKINGQDRARDVKAPVLLMAGWYDPFLPSQINDYLNIRNRADPGIAAATRLVIGPWAHARTVDLPQARKTASYRKESLGPSIDWFDRHLNSESTADELAPVRIFVMGDNVWRDEQEWPLARTQYQPYYLRSDGNANTAAGDGRLTTELPSTIEPSDTFVYDPQDPVPTAGGAMIGPRAGAALQNAVEERADVLVYTTTPLAQDVEVTGPVTLILYVSTSAANTDFTAKLVDVHHDGKAFNVADGILRRSYNGPDRISIELWPTSMVFHAGHRIRLEVSSSNYPRYDRNPNTGGDVATATETVAAAQTVHHGIDTPSHLILPLIPR